jgi:hypothetical protein
MSTDWAFIAVSGLLRERLTAGRAHASTSSRIEP